MVEMRIVLQCKNWQRDKTTRKEWNVGVFYQWKIQEFKITTAIINKIKIK
jgi:hypothetical protein